VVFTPGTEQCCRSNKYTLATQFCVGTSIYGKCGGSDYSPATESCCNGNKYTLATQFCSGDGSGVYSRCGEQTYTPAIQRCGSGNVIETKCGTNWYSFSSSTHYCKNSTAWTQYGSLFYEGKTYKTVEIGTQTWMAENLNYAASGSKCGSTLSGKGTLGEVNTSTCDTYGRLYNWATAMANSASSFVNPSGVKGVCPTGWHLPSDAEWTTLTYYVDSFYEYPGTKLKATSGWFLNNSVPIGTDDYGFSALPGGYGYSRGDFGNAGNSGFWWSATEYGASLAYYRSLHSGGTNVDRNRNDKTDLYSVRCVQD
jgi:uncharacterized protein (TIGR02145 family)